MLRIGLFSKLGKTTIQTLRHYDETGLLRPVFTDESTGYRFYDVSQLARLHEIVNLDIIAPLDYREIMKSDMGYKPSVCLAELPKSAVITRLYATDNLCIGVMHCLDVKRRALNRLINGYCHYGHPS